MGRRRRHSGVAYTGLVDAGTTSDGGGGDLLEDELGGATDLEAGGRGAGAAAAAAAGAAGRVAPARHPATRELDEMANVPESGVQLVMLANTPRTPNPAADMSEPELDMTADWDATVSSPFVGEYTPVRAASPASRGSPSRTASPHGRPRHLHHTAPSHAPSAVASAGTAGGQHIQMVERHSKPRSTDGARELVARATLSGDAAVAMQRQPLAMPDRHAHLDNNDSVGDADATNVHVQQDSDLAPLSSDADADADSQPPAVTPLPWGQCAVALGSEFCEGFQITVLFPFVVFMVKDFGVPDEKTGFYAGALTAAYCLAQFLSSFAWGYISDKWGRKRAIVGGLLGTGIANLVFGTSLQFSQAVVGRLLGGLLCGNIGVIKAFLSDVTDDTNRAEAFSFISFAWGAGAVVGPVAGGYLTQPARWGGIFDTSLFLTYPYLLPCLVGFVLQMLTALIVGVVMVEPRHDYEPLDTANPTDASASASSMSLRNQSPVAILCRRKPLLSVALYLVCCLSYIVFDEALPLFQASPRFYNGLGFTDHEIGAMLMVNGLTLLGFTVWVFPHISRRLSLVAVLQLGFIGSLAHLCAPIATYVVDASRVTAYAIVGLVMMSNAAFGSTAFTASIVVVNNSVPSRYVGLVNGFGQSMAALCRTIGPAAAGSVWSISETMDVPGHTYIVFIMGGLVLGAGMVLTMFVSKDMEKAHRES